MACIFGGHCLRCDFRMNAEAAQSACPLCDGGIEFLLKFSDQDADRDRLSAIPDFNMGRYEALLPLPGLAAVANGIGGTPLLEAKNLGKTLGLEQLKLKDDTRNPSASLKDRATLAVLMAAKERGHKIVATASTGNAAASLAALSVRIGIEAIVFAPKDAPPAKLNQVLAHGARLYRVDGDYDYAYDLCQAAVRKFGWYSRSTGNNPYCAEGKKTVAFEIAEQLEWKAPDFVFVPTGDGSILGSTHKGFRELFELGWIDKMPRLVAVQAEGSCSVVDAWEMGRNIQAVLSKTLADSIAVDYPRDGERALRALKESEGFGLRVSDEEILDALGMLARSEGIFAEPAAAAAIAGLKRAVDDKLLPREATIVALITGHGLKDSGALAPKFDPSQLVSKLGDLA